MDYKKLLQACSEESLDKATLGIIKGIVENACDFISIERKEYVKRMCESMEEIELVFQAYDKLHEQTK
jgi:hypothetical protein